MNRDDVIRMARDCGINFHQVGWPELERFAALVAAAEREACIDIIDTYRIPVGNSAAGEMACEWTYAALKEIREDIRARGQA